MFLREPQLPKNNRKKTTAHIDVETPVPAGVDILGRLGLHRLFDGRGQTDEPGVALGVVVCNHQTIG